MDEDCLGRTGDASSSRRKGNDGPLSAALFVRECKVVRTYNRKKFRKAHNFFSHYKTSCLFQNLYLIENKKIEKNNFHEIKLYDKRVPITVIFI